MSSINSTRSESQTSYASSAGGGRDDDDRQVKDFKDTRELAGRVGQDLENATGIPGLKAVSQAVGSVIVSLKPSLGWYGDK